MARGACMSKFISKFLVSFVFISISSCVPVYASQSATNGLGGQALNLAALALIDFAISKAKFLKPNSGLEIGLEIGKKIISLFFKRRF